MTDKREYAPALRTLSSALLLFGLFVMVSGDLSPRPFDSPGPRLLVPLFWRGLYLALLALSVLCSLAAGPSPRDLLASLRTLRFLGGPVACLTAAFLLSALLSPEASLSLTGFGYYLLLIFSLLLFQVGLREAEPEHLWRVIAMAALVLAARTIWWRLDEGLGTLAAQVRNNAWLGKLQIAWVLGLLAPAAFGRFLSSSDKRWRSLFLAAWLFSGVAILVLWAKTGIAAFAVSTLLLCALNAAAWRKWLPPAAGIALVAMLAVHGTLSPSAALLNPAGRLAVDSGSALRLRIWQDSFKMFLDHPLTGIGVGTYDALAYTKYPTKEDVGPGGRNWFYMKGWHAHNVFVQVLAETGVLGFLAWMYLLGALTVYFFRAWRTAGSGETRIHAASMICCLVSFVLLAQTEAMLAVRVHASLRMNLTLWITLLLGVRTVFRTRESPRGPAERIRPAGVA
jgi:O-antigen ligase